MECSKKFTLALAFCVLRLYMVVGEVLGGGSTSQYPVDGERQPVPTAIAIDSYDAMDGILGAGPIDTARSISATLITLAACDGDAAEKSSAD